MLTKMMSFLKKLFSNKEDNKMQEIINNAFLVDVRTPQEFAEGNVEGSVNIPLNNLPNELSKFKNKNSIIVFCRSGNRSEQAKIILEQNGFANVVNGGTWQNVHSLIKK
jgi:phage shock protein E